MDLTREEIRLRIGEVADSVWGAVPTLVENVHHELDRLGTARHDMDSVLSEGSRVTLSAGVRDNFERARLANTLLCDATLQLTTDALGPLAEVAAGATSAQPRPGPATPDVRDALAELARIGVGIEVARLSTGLVLIQVVASIEDYLALCEAYLQREIGSHEAWKRIAPVLVGVGKAAAGAAFGPVGLLLDVAEVVVRAGKQAATSPLDKDLERVRRTADDMARLDQLELALLARLEAMQEIERTMASVVSGVTSNIESARTYVERLGPLFGPDD